MLNSSIFPTFKKIHSCVLALQIILALSTSLNAMWHSARPADSARPENTTASGFTVQIYTTVGLKKSAKENT